MGRETIWRYKDALKEKGEVVSFPFNTRKNFSICTNPYSWRWFNNPPLPVPLQYYPTPNSAMLSSTLEVHSRTPSWLPLLVFSSQFPYFRGTPTLCLDPHLTESWKLCRLSWAVSGTPACFLPPDTSALLLSSVWDIQMMSFIWLFTRCWRESGSCYSIIGRRGSSERILRSILDS